MRYENVLTGRFIERSNRFIAHVEIDGKPEICHVKNTGRCRELLIPGAKVVLSRAANSGRKTAYDLIAVRKGERLINIDSQAPNAVAAEYLFRLYPGAELTAERKYGKSRFDFMLKTGERIKYIEVKGVTLEENGLAMFPDAPTERGVKHLRELMRAGDEGYGAAVLFVIQMKGVSAFTANARTHPEFAIALREAARHGVELYALDCVVSEDEIYADSPVEILL
ncbi:MAG: DNA/RNA nuclease SfsA [Oscillospiraceae bacterium]|nr:DNA/RNA nuclease SfsA [Oscillospiraceae bacterium]